MTTARNLDELQPGGDVKAIVGERLSLAAFSQLSGRLGGYAFVKVVVERAARITHFINNGAFQFHASYIADALLGISEAALDADIDAYNRKFYAEPDRPYLLAILALHKRDERHLYSLETVEIDVMDGALVQELYAAVKACVDPAIPVFFKPANHHQEQLLQGLDPAALPRVFHRELFSAAAYVPLNPGRAQGRLRLFPTEADYAAHRDSLEWSDIIVMHRVPDDIPRLSGIINAAQTTPLSHTNVLATGWQIPNAIDLTVVARIKAEALDGCWVEYVVDPQAEAVGLTRLARPPGVAEPAAWKASRVVLEEPVIGQTPILPLSQLRTGDRNRYGTKAANLGELHHVLRSGSERLTGFYKVARPPRANLLPYLRSFLELPDGHDAGQGASLFLKAHVRVPGGIALPFSLQQEFLASSPQIQQMIGKLKMAIELKARQVDALCVTLQQMIVRTRLEGPMRAYIDAAIEGELAGVHTMVVRSSSNAEDLPNFSAAGIYESINHVTTTDTLFESIKQVWASLFSARSVRLRTDAGISLDESYMGVVIQEQLRSRLGGVLVTTNPLERGDFRNVYFNVSRTSVMKVVAGTEQASQYLFNTVEGGGRTLCLGDDGPDLPPAQMAQLQRLAFAGRLLQSHFSRTYTFSDAVDIEWLINDDGIWVLQLRPFAGGGPR